MIPFEARVESELRKELETEILRRQQGLGSASSIVENDAAATGMKCARQIGHIDGLKSALKIMGQIIDDLSGKAKPREDKR